MYHIYAIYNREANRIYIGQTDNLESRLELHNKKMLKRSYTSRFDGIWVLIYTETVLSREEALKREKQLKSYRGREFIRKYVPE